MKNTVKLTEYRLGGRADIVNKAEKAKADYTIKTYDHNWIHSQLDRLALERTIRAYKLVLSSVGVGVWVQRTESIKFLPFEDVQVGVGGITVFKAIAKGLCCGNGVWQTESLGFCQG